MSTHGSSVISRHGQYVRTRSTHGSAGFDPTPTAPFYGSQADVEPMPVSDVSGQIDGGSQILPGSIPPTAFASTIRPPMVVTALPALPSSSFPQGSLVFLTTDQKLYRNTNGSTWSKATDGADILADSITAGQIAAAAIGVSELAAGAVTADAIAAGTISARHLAIGTGQNGNLLRNGGFEEGNGPSDVWSTDGSLIPGWSRGPSWQWNSTIYASGTHLLSLLSDGVVSNWGCSQRVPVVPGRTYRLSGRCWPTTSGDTAQILAHARAADGSNVAFNALVAVSTTTPSSQSGADTYTVPAGVAFLDVYCRWGGTPVSGRQFHFDDVALELVPAAAQNATAEVVIDEAGIAVTNGKITVNNPSGTVLIDGTSEIFLLAATGTLAVNTPTGSPTTNSNSVTLTLGLPYVPAAWAYRNDNADPNLMAPLPETIYNPISGAIRNSKRINVIKASSTQTTFRVYVDHDGGMNISTVYRYFILSRQAF